MLICTHDEHFPPELTIRLVTVPHELHLPIVVVVPATDDLGIDMTGGQLARFFERLERCMTTSSSSSDEQEDDGGTDEMAFEEAPFFVEHEHDV